MEQPQILENTGQFLLSVAWAESLTTVLQHGWAMNLWPVEELLEPSSRASSRVCSSSALTVELATPVCALWEKMSQFVPYVATKKGDVREHLRWVTLVIASAGVKVVLVKTLGFCLNLFSLSRWFHWKRTQSHSRRSLFRATKTPHPCFFWKSCLIPQQLHWHRLSNK